MESEPVVGRERELEAVRASLDRGGALLVLEGDAGIGKTTVWLAGVEAARAQGHRVLVARPAEVETMLAYATLADLLEPVLDDGLRRMPPPQRQALEVVFARREREASSDGRVVAAAALTAVRTLAEDEPVLVAVDDVQWVDAASAEALAFALRRLAGEGVSFLGTERRGAGTGLRVAEADRVSIPPLGPDEIARIVRDRLGVDVHRSILRRLAERSGGNPFFALELARDGRLLDDPDAPLPPSLDALLRDRISAAPSAVRDALLVAALHPAPTQELLARAGVTPAGLASALELDLVVAVGERLRFSHPLIAAAVLARTTAARRRQAHARLVEALDDPEERLLHLALAVQRADESVAAQLEAGARRMARRGAAAVAGELAGHAARLTPPELDVARRRRALVHADLVGVAGDEARSYALLQQLARETPHGPERALVLVKLAHRSFELDEQIRLCKEALTEADTLGRAKALLHLAWVHWMRGELDDLARLVDEALPIAEESEDTEVLVDALMKRSLVQWSLGEGLPEELLVRARDLLAAEGRRAVLGETYPERELALDLLVVGEYARARTLLETNLEVARDLGDEPAVSGCLAQLAGLEARVGNAQRAELLADEAVALARQFQEPFALCFTLHWRARALVLVSRLDDSRADAEELLATATGWELFRSLALDVLGYVALTSGDLETAARHLQDVLDGMHAFGWREPSVVDAQHNLAEVYALRGELERAEEVLDELEAVARPIDRTRSLAGALRVRGLIAARRGDVARAEELLHEALGEQARRPEPLESGRTLLHLGTLLRRVNRKRDARAVLEEAVRTLTSCGATIWAGRASAELARISGRPIRSGAMTATEDQIAHLVAAGKSNHEVARALSVSPKTVEWNLSKIYRKLHVRSRTELASKLAERVRR